MVVLLITDDGWKEALCSEYSLAMVAMGFINAVRPVLTRGLLQKHVAEKGAYSTELIKIFNSVANSHFFIAAKCMLSAAIFDFKFKKMVGIIKV